MRRLALALVLVMVPCAADARSRKHREIAPDDRVATRTDVAVALQPVIDARTADDGRQYTARDIANLEDTAITITDETVNTQERVARLNFEIEQLRRDIQELRRMRRRRW